MTLVLCDLKGYCDNNTDDGINCKNCMHNTHMELEAKKVRAPYRDGFIPITKRGKWK